MNEQVFIAIIGGLLGGSAVAALINQIGESIRQKRKRKYDKDDSVSAEMDAVKKALRWVLFDRIRYLGLSYIAEKKISFEDRRILNEMHKSYHELEGDGDLDNLMKDVNSIPLRS